MSETTVPQAGPAEPTPLSEEASSKKEFEELQRSMAEAQNLPSGSVPEQRPIASQRVDDEALHSRVYRELRDSGDPRGGAPAMPKSAYDKAASKEQAKKAAKESRVPTFHVGARAYIEKPGSPDHGRAVAVNRIVSYKSLNDQILAGLGTAESRFAQADEVEVVSRDARAEMLIVSADDLRLAPNHGDWNRTTVD